MKKLYYLITLLLTLLIFSNHSTAQQQAFKLGIINLQYRDTLGGTNNVLHFDIVMQHINEEISGPFEYITAQYFMNFNSAIANGGDLNYRRIGSDLPVNFRPVNPSITGNILRMAGNFPATPGPLISTSYPGTLISRMRLTTTANSFANVPLSLSWRAPEDPQPHTLVAAANGLFAVDISNNGYYYVDSLNNMNIVNLLIPGYNSAVYNSTVIFKWNKVNHASAYTLQVATDSAMHSLIYNEPAGQDTSGTVSELLLGSRFYWRLKILDSSGTDYYSYKSRFYTKAVLKSPLDKSINQPQSVNFEWSKVSDSVSNYIIQISEDSLFNSLSFSDTVATDTSKLIRGLKFNSRYFWRIKAMYPSGGHELTSAWSLKTLNESIHPTWPAYNYDFFTTSIEFKWDTPSIINYSKYYLKIAKDTLLNNVFFYDSVENANSLFVNKLDFNQRYYWTVAVKDSFNNFVTSDIWTFRITDLVMTLYSPGNNFNDRNIFLDLIWRKPVINALRYKLIFPGICYKTI
ncbi:MAG: fibronectin type III domain-containing protein [Ignavibacteria bacterium]